MKRLVSQQLNKLTIKLFQNVRTTFLAISGRNLS